MEGDFQIKEIKQEKIPVYRTPMPPKKRGLDLISLFTKKNLPKTLLVIIIIFILVAVAAIIWGRYSFSRSKVGIDIEAPGDIASGKEVTLTVKYKNDNRVSLDDAYLIIDYPSGTFSLEGKEIYQDQRKLGVISGKSGGEESFKVRFVGEKEEVKNLSVRLNYQPRNINSRFENSSSFRIEISSVLIEIKIDGSENTTAGQAVNYLIEYENKTNEDVFNLKIKLAYPDDFEFKSADPEPAEDNNIWEIDVIKAGQKNKIDLKGILQGKEGESKVFKAEIGKMENNLFLQYSQSEFITKITPSPLLLLLQAEGVEQECRVDPGQGLHYTIEFKNNTDVALQALVLKAYFEDNVFDFKTLDLGNVGFFDSRKNIITWSGAEIPSLALLEPNQSGKVSFSVGIKNSLPIFSYNDKNFQAKISAEIETLTVPAKFAVSELKVSKELICKINTRLNLSAKVYYYEPGAGVFNTGPIPPRVNQLTTYTVHWQIINTSNEVENVRVKTTLPQGINWSNYYINKVEGSNLYYNERTKEVVWEISKVPAGVGIVLPVYELIFQIGLRPSINQVGQTPTLINQSFIEGKDTFTETTLEDSNPEVDTSLPDDPRIGFYEGRVKE